ncbi:MAG: hypothetical protein QOG49_35 [Frankiaceae bacterium]|nr:hypothetical protein [Frankiaceae bacterium]
MVAWQLSGFGDEIDDDPAVQVAVLQALGASYIEVRSAWGINTIDLSAEQLHRLAALFKATGMGVSAIASPVGKVDVGLPVSHEVERLGRAIAAAHAFDSSFVRIFSFYYPEAVEVDSVRDAVLTRMRALADLAERESVVLLHENEKDIYGDTPDRVLDLIESVGSPALRVAWDPANFVQVGVRPFEEGYAKLRPHFAYLQVKDALAASGDVTPAGEGDGDVLQTVEALRDDGYAGFASLEPHLTEAFGQGGYSGPIAFGIAARAFARVADRAGVDLE